MLGRIDAPAVGPVPEEVDDLVREHALAIGWKVSVEERVVHIPLAQLGDQLDERRLQLPEQRPHLGGRPLRLPSLRQPHPTPPPPPPPPRPPTPPSPPHPAQG